MFILFKMSANIAIDDRAVEELNSLSDVDFSAVLNKINTEKFGNLTVHANTKILDTKKLQDIVTAYMAGPASSTDDKKSLTMLYNTKNISQIRSDEQNIAKLAANNPRLSNIHYRFDAINQSTLSEVCAVITASSFISASHISINTWSDPATTIASEQLSYDNCMQLMHLARAQFPNSSVRFNLDLIYNNLEPKQQRELLLEYLKLLLHPSLDSLPEPDLDKFDLNPEQYPTAYFDLLNAFIDYSQNRFHVPQLIQDYRKQELTNEQRCKLYLKAVALHEGITDFDCNNLSVENITKLMHKIKGYSKGIHAFDLFIRKHYKFANTAEKIAYFENILILNDTVLIDGVDLTYEEVLSIVNQTQIAPIASRFFSLHKDELSHAQRLELIALCHDNKGWLDWSGIKLTPEEAFEIAKKYNDIYSLVIALQGAGLDKTAILQFIERHLQYFDLAEVKIDLNRLKLSKSEILEFVQRNPGSGHVIDTWVESQKKHIYSTSADNVLVCKTVEHLTIAELRELMEIRLKNSKYCIDSSFIDIYKLTDAELVEILIKCNEPGNTIYSTIQVFKKLNWEQIYKVHEKDIEDSPANILALKDYDPADCPANIKEYMSLIPDMEELQEELATVVEYFAYFLELRSNLLNVFCRINKCEDLRINLETIENKLFDMQPSLDNIQAYLYNLFWWIGVCARIIAEIEPAKTHQCFADKNFVIAMQEIAAFASPDFRNIFAKHIINLIKNDKIAQFSNLIAGTSRRMQIPAVLILANTEQPQQFKEVLELIGPEYNDSKNLKILLNSFASIFSCKELSDAQKFALAKKVLAYQIEYKVFKSQQDMEAMHREFPYSPTFTFNNALISNLEGTKQLGLIAYDIDGNLINVMDMGDDVRLAPVQEILTKWLERNKKISRIIKQIIPELVKLKFFPCGLQSEIQALLMVQGLAAIDKLPAIIEDASFAKKSWRSVYSEVLQVCFELNEQQLQQVQNTLAPCRNPFSIIAYYARLKTLKEPVYIDMLRSYVRYISSYKARTFYKRRYDLKDQQHLQQLGLDELLLNKWRKGAGVNYDKFYAFIKDKVPTLSAAKTDPVEFLKRQITYFKHLPINSFKLIHDFLAAKSESQRIAIQNEANSKIAELKGENYYLKQRREKLKLQSALMEFFNKRSEFDERQVMLALNRIENLADNCTECNDFQNDMNNITNLLLAQSEPKGNKQNKKEVDTTGWQLIDTDHFWDMLLIGTDVFGSCQNINGTPRLNRCLIGGYVLSGHIRQIALKNTAGEIVARAVFRLMRDKKTHLPVLFLEEVYPNFSNDEYVQAIEAFAMLRAWELGCILVSKTSVLSRQLYPGVLEVTAVKHAEYVDAIGEVQEHAYEVSGSTLICDPPKERELILHKYTGRPHYGPRPLNSVQDLKFMYRNYVAQNSDATVPEFVRKINLRLTAR
jgi:hypothetical protein